MLRICTICARGGSKGVPNKNIRPLLGKPLIAHSIEQARASGLFAALAVSSDSDAILAAAAAAGVEHLVKRPDAMASDQAAKLPAIQHCVKSVEEKTGQRFDIMVDLDATAPLRLAEDIAGGQRRYLLRASEAARAHLDRAREDGEHRRALVMLADDPSQPASDGCF